MMVDLFNERKGEQYPRHLLEGCRSALVLFAAGFCGANDGVWIKDAGIEDVTCVDIDSEKIEQMRHLYPESWQFIWNDWWAYLMFVGCRSWDMLSVDCPIALIDECARRVPDMLTHANRALVLTSRAGLAPEQESWHLTFRPRTAGIGWAVYER